mgnify:CR=1 FL=1
MKTLRKVSTLLLFVASLQAYSQSVSISNFTLFRNGKSVILQWTLDSGATCNGVWKVKDNWTGGQHKWDTYSREER